MGEMHKLKSQTVMLLYTWKRPELKYFTSMFGIDQRADNVPYKIWLSNPYKRDTDLNKSDCD